MAEDTMRDEHDLQAGDFSAWLADLQRALRGEQDADVPCDGCTSCCTSSQFVHIEPDETETLAHIPPELLFPAPRRPRGHVLLGYDELGRCPMLVDAACSIYEHRPRTCRTYDCRIFPAAGAEADDDVSKVRIAERAKRWRFSFPTDTDRVEHEAVKAAATYFSRHLDVLAPDASGATATSAALLAVDAHEAFLQRDEGSDAPMLIDPEVGAVRVELRRVRAARRA